MSAMGQIKAWGVADWGLQDYCGLKENSVCSDRLGTFVRDGIWWKRKCVVRDRYLCGMILYWELEEGQKSMAFSVDMVIEINEQERIMTKGEYVTEPVYRYLFNRDNLTMDRGILFTKDGEHIEGKFRVIGPAKKNS